MQRKRDEVRPNASTCNSVAGSYALVPGRYHTNIFAPWVRLNDWYGAVGNLTTSAAATLHQLDAGTFVYTPLSVRAYQSVHEAVERERKVPCNSLIEQF